MHSRTSVDDGHVNTSRRLCIEGQPSLDEQYKNHLGNSNNLVTFGLFFLPLFSLMYSACWRARTLLFWLLLVFVFVSEGSDLVVLGGTEKKNEKKNSLSLHLVMGLPSRRRVCHVHVAKKSSRASKSSPQARPWPSRDRVSPSTEASSKHHGGAVVVTTGGPSSPPPTCRLPGLSRRTADGAVGRSVSVVGGCVSGCVSMVLARKKAVPDRKRHPPLYPLQPEGSHLCLCSLWNQPHTDFLSFSPPSSAHRAALQS